MKAISFSLLFVSLAIASALAHDLEADNAVTYCEYTVFIRTGDTVLASTGARITLTLGDKDGLNFTVADLKTWGMLSAGHVYFQRGQVDIFRGNGTCLNGEPCYIRLRSDGLGDSPEWYCNSIEVFRTWGNTKPTGCARQHSTVEQWLAYDQTFNPNLFHATRDECKRAVNAALNHKEELINVD